MSHHPSRALRPRKPYPYLPPESQDPDNQSYSRFNFNREMVSPAMELNWNAKILVKFINNVNKGARSSRRMEMEEEHKKVRPEQIFNEKKPKIKNLYENNKKATVAKKQVKEETIKKEKQHNNLKPTIVSKTTPVQTHFPKQSKPNLNQPSNLVHQFGQYAALLNQYSPKGMDFDPKAIHSFLQAFPQTNLQMSKASIQQWLMNQQNNFVVKPREEPQQVHENKLFGRSAYHVAIAYHIHLKKIKEKGQVENAVTLDPTHSARKLRGEQYYESLAEKGK